MLVPFIIDAESLTPDAEWSPPVQRKCHRDLLDIWLRIGVLVYDGPSLLQSRLYSSIQALPQALRSDWQKMLQRGPILSAAEWNGTVDAMSIDHLATAARVALVEDARAEVEFQLQDQDEDLRNVRGAEISVCRILAANRASPFLNALDNAGVHIEPKDRFDEIWELRFSQLARADIKTVNIVDRYAVGKHYGHRQTSASGLSGLARFLTMLDRTASGERTVTVFSQWTPELNAPVKKTISDIEVDMRQILARLPNQRIKRLKVCMVGKSGFREDSHDRFIRFGDYVWDIGIGLEVFEGAHAPKRSSATFKTGNAVIESYKRVESELSGYRDVQVCELR
jgi:hypothetical protein